MSNEAACIAELRITLPAREDSLALLRHVVRGFRDPYAIAPGTMDDVVLAVSEAAANVVLHAYGERSGTMTVVARIDDSRLNVLVRDHGRGIEPPADTPVLGHGFSLMAHVASSLEIIGSAAGTDVLMTFDITADHDDPAMNDYGAAS